MSTEARKQQLDVSYRDFVKIVWDAEPGLYRCPRANAQRQPSWWNDDCFDAMVARNAAWRQRNRFPELDSNFRAARNHFHRVFHRAKTAFWSNWLQRVERMCPRANSCRVAPRLSPSAQATPHERDDCVHQWRQHFQEASSLSAVSFDRRHHARVCHRVRRIRETREAPHDTHSHLDAPFTREELQAALRQCAQEKSPGCDNIPYKALCADIPWWQHAILQYLELCRSYSCVPSLWKHGIVIPMAKQLDASKRDDYRPITLTSCFAKILERMILNRIRPLVDPQLDDSQAGFRWGSDVQVYALLETIRLRQGSATYCAFLDIRKAFDVAWREGALLKLHRAGVTGDLWHLVDDFVTGRSAAVRVDSCLSDVWSVDDGVGQGAVVSGFLFNLLINGLAAAIKKACQGVTCGSEPNAPRVQVLLYADDIVILCDKPIDLQRALDAANAWTEAWRFHFSVGPTKSAVMVFGRGRVAIPPFPRWHTRPAPCVSVYLPGGYN